MGQPPADPKALPEYLRNELSRLEQALAGLDPQITTKWNHLRPTLRETTAIPTKAAFLGGDVYWFSASDALHLSVALPKSYQEGSTLRPYVRWTTTATASATNNAVVWALDYTLANASATFGAAVTLSATATAAAMNVCHQTALGNLTATAADVNAVLVGKLYRSGGNYTGRAGLLDFTIEYRSDDVGSGDERVKR